MTDHASKTQHYTFVNAAKMASKAFQGKPVTLMGKVDKVASSSEFTLRSTDDQEVVVQLARPADVALTVGKPVEARGMAKNGQTLTTASVSTYESDFDMQSYEQMLEYYHGMCKHLTISAE